MSNLIGKEFDEIHKNLMQARSMLLVIGCEGMDNFDNYDSTTKTNYIWACTDAVDRALKHMDDSIKRNVESNK